MPQVWCSSFPAASMLVLACCTSVQAQALPDLTDRVDDSAGDRTESIEPPSGTSGLPGPGPQRGRGRGSTRALAFGRPSRLAPSRTARELVGVHGFDGSVSDAICRTDTFNSRQNNPTA